MRITVNEIDSNPVEIKLHQVSRVLEISFDNGEKFNLPYEYLRVYTPSAEALGHGPGQEVLQIGKENVTILNIRPIGNYGIAPEFSDGHNSGIFTWQLLYKLGTDYQQLWADYQQRLKAAGHQREARLQNQ